jgi:hypothetical protein
VTNAGFQNHLHALYGLPGGWIYPVTDTSDILSRGLRKKRKTEEELLEEYLASQILLGRRQEALAAKQAAEALVEAEKIKGQERYKRVRLLMMVILLEDE